MFLCVYVWYPSVYTRIGAFYKKKLLHIMNNDSFYSIYLVKKKTVEYSFVHNFSKKRQFVKYYKHYRTLEME